MSFAASRKPAMNRHATCGALYGAKTVTLIEVDLDEGAGVKGDPVRSVRYYYTLDGELLAVRDPANSEGAP